jgi:HEAT repeat protein
MDGFELFETEKAPLIDFTRKELLVGRAVVLVNCDPHNKYFDVVLSCLLKGSSTDNQPRFAIVEGDAREDTLAAWRQKDLEISPVKLSPVQVARALRTLAPTQRNESPVVTVGPLRSPYKFLFHYDPEDEDLFFGREAATREAIVCVDDAPLTLMYGRSGVGKTSIIRAGVMPRLERPEPPRKGALPLYVRVGDDVVRAIAEEVAAHLGETQPNQVTVQQQLQELADKRNMPVVVFVDQFEECFTRLSERSRQDFASLLRRCLSSNEQKIRFVLSFREEFLAQVEALLRYRMRDTGKWRRLFHVLPLREHAKDSDVENEPKAALEKPAAAVGLRIDSEVVASILSDLRTPRGIDPAQLSIVAYSLYERAVFAQSEHREDPATSEQDIESQQTQEMTWSHYSELGRAHGILLGYIDHALKKLPNKQQSVAIALLRRLVMPGQQTKGFLSKQELLSASIENGSDNDVAAVLDFLVHARLVRSMQWGDQPYYELAHECMIERINQWPDSREEQTARSLQEMVRRRLAYWRYDRNQGLMEVSEVESALQELANPHLTLTGEELAFLALRSEQCGKDSAPCIKKLGENPKQQEYGESLLIPVAAVSNQITQRPEQAAEGEDRTQGRQEPMKSAQWAALQVLGKLWGVAEMGDIVNPEVGKRRAAIERIAETRTVNAACIPFSRALLEEDADTCLQAAHTLVHMGGLAASRAITQLRPVDLGRPETDKLTRVVESLEGFVPSLSAIPTSGDEDSTASQVILGWIVLLLHHDHIGVRWKAAQALQRIGWQPPDNANGAAYWFAIGDTGRCIAVGSPGISFLLRRLVDERERAMEALVTVGQPAVDGLASCLQDEDRGLRLSAIQVLQQMGGERVGDVLTGHLAREKDEEVLLATICAAGVFGLTATPALIVPHNKRMLPKDVLTLHERRRPGRCPALRRRRTAGRIQRPARATTSGYSQSSQHWYSGISYLRLIDMLLEYLQDERVAVRHEAATALQQRWWLPTEDAHGAAYWFALADIDSCVAIGEPAKTVLLARLQDQEEDTNLNALRGLGLVHGNSAAVEAVAKKLNSYKSSETVRLAAVQTLRQIGTPAVAALIQSLSHEDEAVRLAIVEALAAIGDGAAVAPLVRRIKRDRNADVRSAAIKALGQIKHPDAVDQLLHLLNSKRSSIRLAAAEALREQADPRCAEALLERTLADKDYRVREAAKGGLVSLGSAEVTALLHLSQSTTQGNDRIIAILDVLGCIGDDAAVDLLTQHLSHDSLDVRRAASTELVRIGENDALDAMVRIGWTHTVAKSALSRYHDDEYERESPTDLLRRVGWAPTHGICGAAYWFDLGDRLKCGEIGSPAIPILLQRLRDHGSDFWNVAEALSNVAEALSLVGEPAIAPLATYLQSGDKDLRCNVVRALNAIGCERAEGVLMDHLLREPEEDVLCATIRALGDFGVNRTRALLVVQKEHILPSIAIEFEARRRQDFERRHDRLVSLFLGYLHDERATVRLAAANALHHRGWLPTNDAYGAAYWLVLGHTDKCVAVGEPAVEIMLARLQDSHIETRQKALEALAQTGGNSQVTAAVAKRLDDESQQVRLAAVRTLAHFDDFGMGTLIEHLDHRDAEVRLAILYALATNSDDYAVAPLLKRLKEERNKRCRLAVIQALGVTKHVEAATPLVRLLKHRDASVRSQATQALQRFAHPKTAKPLLDRVLNERQPDVRRETEIALLQTGPFAVKAMADRLPVTVDDAQNLLLIDILAKTSAEGATGLIVSQLAHNNPSVRQRAAQALGQIQAISTVGDLAVRLEDENLEVRRAAAQALQQIGWESESDADAAAYWFELSTTSAVADIGKRGFDNNASEVNPLDRCIATGPPAVDVLLKRLGDSDKEVRLKALEGLGRIIPHERIVGAVARCLDDQEGEVRLATVLALQKMGAAALGPLIERLTQEDPDVRQAIARVLGSIDDDRAVQALLERVADESNLDVKRRMIDSLGQLGSRQTTRYEAPWLPQDCVTRDQARARPLRNKAASVLVALLQADDLILSESAARALQQMDWVPQEPEAQAAYWYHLGYPDRCLRLGEPAMQLLWQQLGNRSWHARTAAAQVLKEQLWIPSCNAVGASYWLCHGEIEKCKDLDRGATQPLLDALLVGIPDACGAVFALEQVWDDSVIKPAVRSLTEKEFDRLLQVIGKCVYHTNPSLTSYHRRFLFWRRQWQRLARYFAHLVRWWLYSLATSLLGIFYFAIESFLPVYVTFLVFVVLRVLGIALRRIVSVSGTAPLIELFDFFTSPFGPWDALWLLVLVFPIVVLLLRWFTNPWSDPFDRP